MKSKSQKLTYKVNQLESSLNRNNKKIEILKKDFNVKVETVFNEVTQKTETIFSNIKKVENKVKEVDENNFIFFIPLITLKDLQNLQASV